MTSIVLIGPRCTGKTKTGERLAKIRHVPFVDADKAFEENYRQTIKDFVKELGWPAFREAETSTLGQITSAYSDRDIILAPGGGAVAHDQGEEYRRQNVNMLRRFGEVIYILPTPTLPLCSEILVKRMNKDAKSSGQRPSLTGTANQYEDMLKTLEKRHEMYMNAAHQVVYTGEDNPSQTARKINGLVR